MAKRKARIPTNIPFAQIVEVARRYMAPEDIDHHESDLYLRLTPVSAKIVANISRESHAHVERFISNIEPHVVWYDIWWAYHE